jgi:phage shock protein PspC (stress-responsive transcriptional regulator)
MQPPSNQRFHRGSDRIVGGVCSGLAEGLHVDVIWVRLAFVVLAFLQGIGVLLYVVLWVVIPEPAGGQAVSRWSFDSMIADLKNAWAKVRGVFGGPKPVSDPGSTAGGAPASTAGGTPAFASRNQSLLLGLALILIGLVVLANNVGFVRWDVVWPAVLIAFGVVLLARNFARKP